MRHSDLPPKSETEPVVSAKWRLPGSGELEQLDFESGEFFEIKGRRQVYLDSLPYFQVKSFEEQPFERDQTLIFELNSGEELEMSGDMLAMEEFNNSTWAWFKENTES